MSSLSPQDIARITDYVAGELTSEEVARTESWIAEDGERGRLEESLRQSRGILREEWIAEVDVDRNVRALMSEVTGQKGTARRNGGRAKVLFTGETTRVFSRQTLREALPQRKRRLGAVGAPFAVLSVLALVSTIVAKWQFDGRQALPDTPLATYVTGNAERARVELRDGTVVTLNAGTNLSISKDFGRKNRDVHLRYGQAYFQVARSSGTPFVVDVAGNRTTVLGTTFGVRAYSPDTVQVAVREGKVVFKGAVLTNNDIATATLAQGVQVAHAQKVDGLFGFVTGRLVLDEVTLAAAVPELERWYDVKIRFGDPSIGSRHITAVLMSGSPRDLVDILQAIFGISVVRDGRTLTLHTTEHGR